MATARNVHQTKFVAVPFLIGLASVLTSAWMIVTLPSAGALTAGWRHELICSLLAIFAIYAATWAQGRLWPQPAALVATWALVVVLAMLFLSLPLLPALGAAAFLIGVGAVTAMPAELRAARGASPVLEAIVLLGIADLVAITPVFFVLAAGGTLR